MGLSPVSVEGTEQLLAAVGEVWADMQAQGVAPDETIYTSLARAAAVAGDADAALAWARRVVEAETTGGGRAPGGGKMVARLRTFQPALLALALAGRVDDALRVAEEIASLGRDYLDFGGGWGGALSARGRLLAAVGVADSLGWAGLGPVVALGLQSASTRAAPSPPTPPPASPLPLPPRV